jgi:hypothetical protein
VKLFGCEVISSTAPLGTTATGPGSNRNNRVCFADGERFASHAERDHYLVLKARQMAGEISELACHPPYVLQEKFRTPAGEAVRAVEYTPDFQYIENGELVVVEVKGHVDTAYRIRARLFQKQFPTTRFEVMKVERSSRRRAGGTRGKRR